MSVSSADASPATPPETNADPRFAPAAGTIVVAMVLGRSGSDTADVLAPYEVFTTSPAFSTYTVADTASPARIPESKQTRSNAPILGSSRLSRLSTSSSVNAS